MSQLENEIASIVGNPSAFLGDPLREAFARALYHAGLQAARGTRAVAAVGRGPRAEAVKQMANACALPVAVAGALMPDAHVGYGLPIGGVLATDNAVIPYAVGVDIACRMKLTVYDRKANTIAGRARPPREHHRERDALRHGLRVQAAPRARRDGRRLERLARDAALRDKAWTQLGTSGSGNHFVEFGAFTVDAEQARRSASSRANTSRCSRTRGSRGTGAQVCDFYSKRAMARHAALAEGTQAPRVALARRSRRPGILGRDEPDGPLRRGEPRAHPQAHRARSSART